MVALVAEGLLTREMRPEDFFAAVDQNAELRAKVLGMPMLERVSGEQRERERERRLNIDLSNEIARAVAAEKRVAELEAERADIREALQGRFECPGRSEAEQIQAACEEYVLAEDALPEDYDSEDFRLSTAIKSLAGRAEAAEKRVAELEPLLELIPTPWDGYAKPAPVAAPDVAAGCLACAKASRHQSDGMVCALHAELPAPDVAAAEPAPAPFSNLSAKLTEIALGDGPDDEPNIIACRPTGTPIASPNPTRASLNAELAKQHVARQEDDRELRARRDAEGWAHVGGGRVVTVDSAIIATCHGHRWAYATDWPALCRALKLPGWT